MVKGSPNPTLSPILCRDWGVDAETVAVGENAAAMLPFTGFTAKQEQIVNNLTDHVYHGFLEKARPCFLSKSCRKHSRPCLQVLPAMETNQLLSRSRYETKAVQL